MKQLLFLLTFLIPLFLTAQQAEGVIIYEQKINMHKRLTGEREQIKQFVPEFQTSKNQLLFTAEESLFKELDMDEMEVEGDEEGDGMVRIRMKRPTNVVYLNFETNTRVEERDFFDKKYLLEEPIKEASWKMAGESKVILNYPCMKAILQDTSKDRQVSAWFTPAIPVPAGPASFGKLPGMILEVDINDGEIVFTAQEIKLESLEEDAIKAPTKGKKISEEEFDKMMDERMREMGGHRRGGGPGIHIITRERQN